MVGERPQAFSVGLQTGEHAHADDGAEQRGRLGGNVGFRRQRASRDRAAQLLREEHLHLVEPRSHDGARRVRQRRAVERGVDQQAAATLGIGERQRDEFVDQRQDRRERVVESGQAAESLDKPLVGVAGERGDEQAVLVGEAVIERGGAEARRLGKVAQLGPGVAAPPEHGDGAFEDHVVRKGAGAGHRSCG